MTYTEDDIRREHNAALASLTPEQRKSLRRLALARQLSHFRGRSPRRNLKLIFAREANARSRAENPSEAELPQA